MLFFVLVFSTGFLGRRLSHTQTHTNTHSLAHTAEFLMNSNERLLRLLGQTRCAVAVSAPKRAGEQSLHLRVASCCLVAPLQVASCELQVVTAIWLVSGWRDVAADCAADASVAALAFCAPC